jgi:hypothetical protein
MSSLCFDSLSSGGLIVTYRCSSACAHCVYRSSPRRQRAYITPEQAASSFRTVKRLGCRAMHIGGGEPFLDVAALKDVLRAARAEGMAIDYVETNASCCGAESQTVDLLRELQDLGCDTLLVSIDPFHNAFIPLRKVKALMAACHRAGTRVFPWRLEFLDEIDRFDECCPHSLAEYQRVYGPEYLGALERRYGVSLGGRALTTFCPGHPGKPLAQILDEGSRGCTVLANGSHFHADLHGDFVPTKCPGLAVAMADLGAPLDPRRHPALVRLYEGGPAALYRCALAFGFVARPLYALPCELCDHVRTFLATRVAVQFPDLRPGEFYTVDASESVAPAVPAAEA